MEDKSGQKINRLYPQLAADISQQSQEKCYLCSRYILLPKFRLTQRPSATLPSNRLFSSDALFVSVYRPRKAAKAGPAGEKK